MAKVVVFHHALGLTDPVRRFADALGDAGHTVHTPDLYDGQRFDLRPLTFLPASYPRVLRGTVSAPLTLWESMKPAVGSAARPWAARARRPSTARICSVTLAFS